MNARVHSRKPNYFVAIRITDETIIKNYEDFRKRFVKFNSRYRNICTPISDLHLTLCVMSLSDTVKVEQAMQALLDVSLELKARRQSRSSISLEGISTFNGKLVFANAEGGREFLILRSLILSYFDAANVNILNTDFNQHVTLAKVTSPFECKEGVATIDPKSYEADRNIVFGTQLINNISLCKMGPERQTDGFYVTAANAHF